jgi:hypothetical protein
VNQGRILRVAGKGLTIAGVVLAVLAVRVVTSSHAELARADDLRQRGEIETAIVHYRRAASWYAPGNPHVVDALTDLAEIGGAAEDEGDVERALLAYRSIRGAILTTRSTYTPHQDRLARANQRIAALMAAEDPPPMDAGKTQTELEAEHLALLTETRRPSVLWSLVLIAGFLAWVFGAFAFAARAIDEEDRIVVGPARLWGTTVVIGFGLFFLGMALA